MTSTAFPAPAPIARRVRAYFAPVNRTAQTYASFTPAMMSAFDPDGPPSPWVDLGCIENFARKSASQSAAILTGIPAAALEQTRNRLEARITFEFLSWTKLTMALATGSQHLNVLATSPPDSVIAVPAVSVQAGSTASVIALSPADAEKFTPGSMVAVDTDYTGQLGYLGSPVSGAYVRQPLSDIDYIRRITFNVGLVLGISSGNLILAEPLPGGVPASGAKLQAITGFSDREGGSFYQEWSALFLLDGAQGDRIFFHYPRLQPMAEAEESTVPLDDKHKGGLARIPLKGRFLALPVTDPIDHERVLCYRFFKPATYSLV